MMYPIRRKTIFEMKVYKYFIITVIISVLIFGLFICKLVYDAIYEKELNMANKELDTICMSLDSLADGIVKEALYLIVNQNYQKTISNEEDTDYRKFLNSASLSNMLNSIAISQKEWESIAFYKGSDIYKSSYKQYSSRFWEEHMEIVKDFMAARQPSVWQAVPIEEDKKQVEESALSYLRKVYSYSGVFQGVLEINMPYSRLLSIIPEENQNHMEVAFTDADNEIMAATKENSLIEMLGDSKRYIKLNRQSAKTGLTVWVYLDSNYISKNISVLFLPILLLVAAIISIASICISVLSNKISKPITNIENVVKLVSKGYREARIEEIPEGTLGELSLQINEMIQNTDKLIKDNQQIDEQKRRLELSYIQLQINPHFLYNSLETVCGMIEVEEKGNAIQMISNISGLYREILKRGESLIPLEEEISIAENYMKVMQYRYPELFSYRITIEGMDTMKQAAVIKLILQPLAENCIEHGFADKKRHDYFIEIQVRDEQNYCFIDVVDNGKGFQEEERNHLNDLLRSDTMGEAMENFALKNINTRLKLHFGEDFGITILDNEYRGATIRIAIPNRSVGECTNY